VRECIHLVLNWLEMRNAADSDIGECRKLVTLAYALSPTMLVIRDRIGYSRRYSRQPNMFRYSTLRPRGWIYKAVLQICRALLTLYTSHGQRRRWCSNDALMIVKKSRRHVFSPPLLSWISRARASTCTSWSCPWGRATPPLSDPPFPLLFPCHGRRWCFLVSKGQMFDRYCETCGPCNMWSKCRMLTACFTRPRISPACHYNCTRSMRF